MANTTRMTTSCKMPVMAKVNILKLGWIMKILTTNNSRRKRVEFSERKLKFSFTDGSGLTLN